MCRGLISVLFVIVEYFVLIVIFGAGNSFD